MTEYCLVLFGVIQLLLSELFEKLSVDSVAYVHYLMDARLSNASACVFVEH